MKLLPVTANRWFQAAVLAALLVGSAIELCMVVSQIIPSRFDDFLSPWMGFRALLHRVDPYTNDFTNRIQMSEFGKLLIDPAADSQAFVYPAHAAILMAPLAALPWAAARFLLRMLLPPLVLLAAWLWARLSGLGRGRWFGVCLVALSWPAIWAYRQTQLSVVVLAAIAVACFLLVKRRDGLAGVILTIATIKPNLSLLVILWLLLQMALHRRWRFWIGFAIPMAALFGASQLLWPGWIPQWLTAARLYSGPYKPPLLVMELGHTAGLAALGLLGAGVLFRLWMTGRACPGSSHFVYAIALILAFNVCVIPTSMWLIYNELALVPAVFLIFAARMDRNPLHGLAMVGLWLVLAIAPVCAAAFLVLGFRVYLGFLPFMNGLIVPVVAVALVSRGPIVPAREPTPAAV